MRWEETDLGVRIWGALIHEDDVGESERLEVIFSSSTRAIVTQELLNEIQSRRERRVDTVKEESTIKNEWRRAKAARISLTLFVLTVIWSSKKSKKMGYKKNQSELTVVNFFHFFFYFEKKWRNKFEAFYSKWLFEYFLISFLHITFRSARSGWTARRSLERSSRPLIAASALRIANCGFSGPNEIFTFDRFDAFEIIRIFPVESTKYAKRLRQLENIIWITKKIRTRRRKILKRKMRFD